VQKNKEKNKENNNKNQKCCLLISQDWLA